MQIICKKLKKKKKNDSDWKQKKGSLKSLASLKSNVNK